MSLTIFKNMAYFIKIMGKLIVSDSLSMAQSKYFTPANKFMLLKMC